jgi:hypothetical protein
MLHKIRRHASASSILPVKRGSSDARTISPCLGSDRCFSGVANSCNGLAATSGGPALILSPTTSTGTYNYGTLDAGQTASQTFTITNSGGRVPGWGAFPLLLASLLAHALVHDAASAAHGHYLLL